MMTATLENISLNSYDKANFIIATATKITPRKIRSQSYYQIVLDVGEKLFAEHKTQFPKKPFKSYAQLTVNHKKEDLTGKQLLCVANFPRKQISNTMSDCLVTGVQDLGLFNKTPSTIAIGPSEELPNGSLMNLDCQLKIMESNKRDLTTADWLSMDLRIGTVKSGKLVETSEKMKRILLDVDFGTGKNMKTVANWSEVPKTIIGKQALAVVNINPKELSDYYGVECDALLLSPKDGVWLTPFKPVKNGYKLA